MSYDCPTDLVPNEIIEIEDPNDSKPIDAKVVDTISGITSVAIESLMDTVCTIDPRYTKWRRKAPKEVYGVRCTDKYCGEFYPDQIFSENFLCYRCRHR